MIKQQRNIMVKIKYDPENPLTPEQIEDLESKYGKLQRYKAGKFKGLPKIQRLDTDQPLLKWGKGTYRFEGLVNFNELPKHVSEQFTGDRAEFKGKRVHTACGTPIYSTGDDDSVGFNILKHTRLLTLIIFNKVIRRGIFD